jgi:hypothetical protein
MRRLGALLLAVALTVVETAHVGSPNVLFDGSAGAYPVRVIVRPPLVVPGLAEVIVRTTAADVQRIVIQPVFWRTGVAGAPRGDDMSPVAGQSGTFTGQLWLMARGSYSVYVDVHGARGDGRVIVPVNSVATGRLGLSPGLTTVLVALGLVLFAGLVTIVRAAVGESLLRQARRSSRPRVAARMWSRSSPFPRSPSFCSAGRNGGVPSTRSIGIDVPRAGRRSLRRRERADASTHRA